MKTKKSEVKTTAKVESKVKSTDKKTKVVSALTSLVNTLVALLTVKAIIDFTEENNKTKVHTFKSKYFTVKINESNILARQVTSASKEYLVQDMLLNNKSCLQIYNAFDKRFTAKDEEKFNKSTRAKRQTFAEYKLERFDKYFKQEVRSITEHKRVIVSAYKK